MQAITNAGASNTSGNGGEVADSNKGTNPSAPKKTEKVTAGQIEFFAPAVAEQPSFFVSQFNPLQYALINTQLLKGDKIDPRKIDFFVPQNYVTHVPAFMSIVQESTVRSLKTATGNKENLPTIESPFETKNGTAIYNQFSLTQTIEMYSEKFQVD